VTKRNRSTPARSASPRAASRSGAARPERSSARVVAATALAALVALAGVVYLTQLDRGSDAVASDGALPPADFPDPGIAHVHGLGVDPADGDLYAATHYGLFRLPEDGSEATRVANRYQDTMGFTVVGPNTFLGSGHPDFREDDEPRLGLIESTDAGQSWQPLSLRGEADFHALHAAHGNVYGYEAGSGAFMVSADRKTWETRSRLPMRDFAVSPTDADTVLATTQRGLARSTDGGRTWEGVPAPALAVLASEDADTLFGIGPDGTVHHSADGGASWTQRGSVGGPPEAVTFDADPGAGEGTLYVAVSEQGILQSTDGGRTFTTRYAE
jgi:hypothetical protein